jgi:hypothetical protein
MFWPIMSLMTFSDSPDVAGPLTARVRKVASGTLAWLTGTKYSRACRDSVNQAPSEVEATSLTSEVCGLPNW